MVSYMYFTIITSGKVYCSRRTIFQNGHLSFVDVSEEEVNFIKENPILRNTKHATKFKMNCAKCNKEIILK